MPGRSSAHANANTNMPSAYHGYPWTTSKNNYWDNRNYYYGDGGYYPAFNYYTHVKSNHRNGKKKAWSNNHHNQFNLDEYAGIYTYPHNTQRWVYS